MILIWDRRLPHVMNGSLKNGEGDIGYGRVVECAHADQQTLAVIDSYHFKGVAYDNWNSNNESEDNIAIKLLKSAADKLGFRLLKKTKKQSKSSMTWQETLAQDTKGWEESHVLKGGSLE